MIKQVKKGNRTLRYEIVFFSRTKIELTKIQIKNKRTSLKTIGQLGKIIEEANRHQMG
jgi:hypothetical protein